MISKHLYIIISLLCFTGYACAAEQPGKMDKTFMEKAVQGNQAEVEIGQLGLKKSSNAQVLNISRHLIHDHETANQALKKVSQELDFPVPKHISQEQSETYKKLSRLKGNAFDETFVKVGLEDHLNDTQAYQKEIEEGKSKPVKDYAITYLPKIQEHKAMFQQAARDLKIEK